MNHKFYIFAIILRIIIGINQNGYIHPDEFFQTLEISAGDVLDIDVFRTWEFTSKTPLRSIVPILIFWSPLFCMIKFINYILSPNLINSTNILTITRIYTILINLNIDYNIFKLARIFLYDKYKALVMLSISYITIIYYSRSFSNTAESLLFSILIFYNSKIIFNKMHLNMYRLEKSKHLLIDWQIRIVEGRFSFPLISFVLVLGIFNRPTFIIFALIPMFYLIFYPIIIHPTYIENILKDLFILLLYFVLYSLIFVCIDSAYYNGVHFYNLEDLITIFSNFIITPLNFIIYNSKSDNLKDHGIHAWYTHIIVNMPLLFGPLVYLLIQHIRNYKNLLSEQLFLLLSILVPLVTLSLFPHQEPRFLIPLLIPIILLCINIIGSKLFMSYLLFNAYLGLIYGFLHQGGVIPVLSNLPQLIDNTNKTVIFWKTYMSPRFILMQRVEKESNHIDIVDLAGVSYSDVFQKYINNKSDFNNKEGKSSIHKKLFVIPGTLSEFFKCNLTSEGFILQEVKRYYFHLSIEDLPTFLTELSCNNDSVHFNFLQSVVNFIDQISLVVYELT